MVLEIAVEEYFQDEIGVNEEKLLAQRRRSDLEREKERLEFARNKGRKTNGDKLPSDLRSFGRSGGRVKRVVNSHSKFGLVDMVDNGVIGWDGSYVRFFPDGSFVELGDIEDSSYSLVHDEVDFWEQRLLQNPRNREYRMSPWRTRRDVKGGSRKHKTHISRQRRLKTTKRRTVKCPYTGKMMVDYVEKVYGPKKRKTRFREKSKRKVRLPPPKYITLPNEERRINHLGNLARACQYVGDRIAAPDHFHHRIPQINGALQIILTYIKSRADRALPINISEVVHGKNGVINNRLSKWESKYKKGIISLHHLLAGRFYAIKDDEDGQEDVFEHDIFGNKTGKLRYVFIPVGTEVVVSDGYASEPGRYVINRKEMLSAVRRIIKGDITDMNYFRILDPVTHITLHWCIEQVGCYRKMFDGELSGTDMNKYVPFSAENVVDFRIPGLVNLLGDEKLLDDSGKPLAYRFHMRLLPKTQVEEAEKRADKLAKEGAARAEKEALYKEIGRMRAWNWR